MADRTGMTEWPPIARVALAQAAEKIRAGVFIRAEQPALDKIAELIETCPATGAVFTREALARYYGWRISLALAKGFGAGFGFGAALMLGIVLASLGGAMPASGADLPLRVIDGDTVEAGGVTYRLPGVDAAERNAPCAAGREEAERARRALEDFLREGRIEIAPTGALCGWGRPCADLIVNGRSAIKEGVEAGWLRPWPSCGPQGCDEAARPRWCGEGE